MKLSQFKQRKLDSKLHKADEYYLRSIPDQKIAMVDLALVILKSDPTYRAGAVALLKYQEDHHLLPEKFWLGHAG